MIPYKNSCVQCKLILVYTRRAKVTEQAYLHVVYVVGYRIAWSRGLE